MDGNWFSDMFDNIGQKLQRVAKTIAWIDIILSFIGGFVLLIQAFTNLEFLWYLIFLVPVIVAIGCFAAWLSVATLYGLGVLIEDTHAIRTNHATLLKSIDVKLDFLAKPAMQEAEEKAKQEAAERARLAAEAKARRDAEIHARREAESWICPRCSTRNLAVRTDCWSCGAKK